MEINARSPFSVNGIGSREAEIRKGVFSTQFRTKGEAALVQTNAKVEVGRAHRAKPQFAIDEQLLAQQRGEIGQTPTKTSAQLQMFS